MSSSAGEYLKMPGVSDLKGKAKMNFALALSAEAQGRTVAADEYLAKAIESEAKGE